MVNSRLTRLAKMLKIGTNIAGRVNQLINIECKVTDRKRT